MAIANSEQKSVYAKIVYAGITGCGKATNLRSILQKTHKDLLKLTSSEIEDCYSDTLKAPFNFVPLEFGVVGETQMRLNIYSLGFSSDFEDVENFILHGIDGLVIVIDSQLYLIEENLKEIKRLETLLASSAEFKKVPIIFQYNKTDLPNSLKLHQLKKIYNDKNYPEIEASASNHKATMETLILITKAVLKTVLES